MQKDQHISQSKSKSNQLSTYKKNTETRKLQSQNKRASEKLPDSERPKLNSALELKPRLSIGITNSQHNSNHQFSPEKVEDSSRIATSVTRISNLQEERILRKLNKSLSRSDSKSLLVFSQNQTFDQTEIDINQLCSQKAMIKHSPNAVEFRSREQRFKKNVMEYSDGKINFNEKNKSSLNLTKQIIIEDMSPPASSGSEVKMIFQQTADGEQPYINQLRENSEQNLKSLERMWGHLKQEHINRSKSRDSSNDKSQLKHFSKNLKLHSQMMSQNSSILKEILKTPQNDSQNNQLINIIEDELQECQNYLENHDLIDEKSKPESGIKLNETLSFNFIKNKFNYDDQNMQIQKGLALLKRKQISTKVSTSRKDSFQATTKMPISSKIFTPDPQRKATQDKIHSFKKFVQPQHLRASSDFEDFEKTQPNTFQNNRRSSAYLIEQKNNSIEKFRKQESGCGQQQQQVQGAFNKSMETIDLQNILKTLNNKPPFVQNQKQLLFSPQLSKRDSLIENNQYSDLSKQQHKTFDQNGNSQTQSYIQNDKNKALSYKRISLDEENEEKQGVDRLQLMISNIKQKMGQLQETLPKQLHSTNRKSLPRKSMNDQDTSALYILNDYQNETPQKPNQFNSAYYFKNSHDNFNLTIFNKDSSTPQPSDNKSTSQQRSQQYVSKLRQPTQIKKAPSSTKQSQTDLIKLTYQVSGVSKNKAKIINSLNTTQATTYLNSKRSSLSNNYFTKQK